MLGSVAARAMSGFEQVRDGVVTPRGLDDRLQVLDVRANDREAPSPARRSR